MTPLDAPRIVPFTYQPADYGERIRSPSPVSMDMLPPRPITVPIIHEYIAPPPPPQWSRRQTHPRPTSAEDQRDSVASYVPGEVPPWVPPPQGQPPITFRDEPPRAPELPQERGDRFHGPPGPTPRPILVSSNYLSIFRVMQLTRCQPPGGLYRDPGRLPSAPPSLGGEGERRVGTSWYRPSRETRPPRVCKCDL